MLSEDNHRAFKGTTMSNKILTIMFADVSGSSRLFKTVGDTRAREVVSLAVTMMMDKTLENHGTVIKTIGDEVMAAFDSVDAAVHAAISIQNTISARTAEIPLSIRIGVHEGSVIEEDADIFGEAVNDAAAIVKEAKGGQILISGSSIKKLSQGLASNSCVFDDIRLKGDDHKQAIHLILWQDDEADSDITVFEPGITPEMVQRFSTSEALTLSYMGRDIVIGKDQTPFSIGRARGSDLRIKSRSASR